MSNAHLKPIKYGRKVGYAENCRFFDRNAKRKLAAHGADLFEPGDFVSPHGVAWRPCGMHYPGVLLVDWISGRRHSVDIPTLTRAAQLGWVWRPDKCGEEKKFTVSRWQDGTHFYVRKPDGDPVTFKGKEKFDTYDEAFRAGTRWAKTQH